MRLKRFSVASWGESDFDESSIFGFTQQLALSRLYRENLLAWLSKIRFEW